MSLLSFIISALEVFLDVRYLRVWFFPLVALAFLVTTPVILRSLTSWR